jgi:hypothetical protein
MKLYYCVHDSTPLALTLNQFNPTSHVSLKSKWIYFQHDTEVTSWMKSYRCLFTDMKKGYLHILLTVAVQLQMTWGFPIMLCCGQPTVGCKKAARPSASAGTQTCLHISTSHTSTSVFSKYYFNKGCKQWGILFASYCYHFGDILPPPAVLKTEAVCPLTYWYTANILLHIAIMQKIKYGVNPKSTVCDIVIIVIAVLDPFCLQKELKVFRWNWGGGSSFTWYIYWFHRNKSTGM